MSGSGYRSPLLGLPGAVVAADPDAGVASHYGNPLIEQRRLRRGDAVDLSHRGVVTVTGPDRLSWLDSMTSQQITELSPGDSAETLLLSANGRIEQVLHLVDDGESCWITVEAGAAENLISWLERMRFRLRVEVADRSADYAIIGLFGADAASSPAPPLEAAAPAGVPLRWVDPWPGVVPGGYRYAAHTSDEPWHFTELIVPREGFAQAALAWVDATTASTTASDAAPTWSGTLALEALRVAAWRPRAATEVDERSIPHELDWLATAVHLKKGCYRGQETVAKVHNLGHPPRRLVLLQLDGSEAVPVEPGAEVWLAASGGRTASPADAVNPADAEKPAGAAANPAYAENSAGAASPVGVVTSVARHAELGPIALALLRRNVDPRADLVVRAAEGEVAANQEIIVPPDAGSVIGRHPGLRRARMR